MDKKNQKARKYLNMGLKKYKVNLILVITLFLVLLLMTLFYVKYIKNLTYKNIYQTVSELSEQTASSLNLIITEQKKFVELLVDNINKGLFEKPEDAFEAYKDDLDDYHFTRLVILDREGNGTTSDGLVSDHYPNINKYFAEHEGKGDSVQLSENSMSAFTNAQVNTYSRLFTFNDKPYILYAVVKTDNYADLLPRKLFNNQGGTYLINNNGEVLIDSYGKITDSHIKIYDYFKNTYNLNTSNAIDKFSNMENSIKDKQNGTFDVNLGKDTYFMHYEKLQINDWYVVTVISDTVIANEFEIFTSTAFIICLGFSIVIVTIYVYINITAQKNNAKLYKTAFIDSVTLLGNESYFIENGSKFLQTNDKQKYIIALDINKFKVLNNIYGYDFCNKILKTLGEKLTNILPTDNITCRISNDIFASIFTYTDNIKNVINKLLKVASKLEIENQKINLNLSIGVYKTLNDTNINKALDKAYMALAKIKGLYNNNYYIFDDILENKLLEEQKIESCMEEALLNNEFKVYYQPKTHAETEKVIGAEALVRWYRNGEIIPPNKFIPLFEKNKFIINLDLYIFEQACKDIAYWKKTYNFIPIISINVSKEHFVNENFIDEYVEITNKYAIDRSKIDLEITESATIDENIDTIKILNKVKENGFVISIDDFGTGYSSLSILQSMPLDILKIDKVFVDKADLTSNKNIINYIMLIAKHLGVKTIVEGVETRAQVEYMKKLKCDVIQGYYYSKPLTKEEFEDYFRKN